MDDVFLIQDLDTLRAIADTRRIDILRLLQEPMTATQLAQRLGDTSNTIYYHIKELEKRGLVRLVETRLLGHLTEKYFQASARGYAPAPTLFEGNFADSIEAEVTLSLRLLESAASELQRSFNAHLFTPENKSQIYLAQNLLTIQSTRMEEFVRRLDELIGEYSADEAQPAENTSLLTILLHPIVTNTTQPTDPDKE